MEIFANYSHALAALAGFALIVMILSPLSAIPKEKANLAPGSTPSGDYDSQAYRLNRAYLNGTESLSAFVTVTLVAMIAGANPTWVNWLASLVLMSRVLHVFVHIQGIGRPHRGPRTFLYVFGWACMIALGVIGIAAALSGATA